MKRTVRLPLTLSRVTAAPSTRRRSATVALDAVEPLEVAFGAPCDDLRERCFSDAGRAEKDERCEPVGFDQPPQRFARREEMALADIFIERARAKARGQRGVCGDGSPRAFRCVAAKKVIHRISVAAVERSRE